MTEERSIDQFLDREYHTRDYNCLHFARDVWLHETGEDLQDRMEEMLRIETSDTRTIDQATRRRFRRLKDGPQDPCIVVMKRMRTEPHIGVYVRGRIVHLSEESGAMHVDPHVATLGYKEVLYYR